MNIEDRVLRQIYNTLTVSHMMARLDSWRLEGRWKETGNVHKLFCKIIQGMKILQ
jgi:hypothetical protein